ncbi:MAG: hypothetical protein L0H73_07275 [Nitrococcus sp.]|nr:hypothetical protein [Nitrococcus sp.]
MVGLVTAVAMQTPSEPARLRAIEQILDTRPVIPAELMELLLWAGRYYQHPISECLAWIPTLVF